MGIRSYEVCDRCSIKLPTKKLMNWSSVSSVSFKLLYAKHGWGHGSDDPCINFEGDLCADCFKIAKKAVEAFIDIWRNE